MIGDREQLRAALPGYTVGDELGRGPWSTVYAGEDRARGRPVVVKVLAAEAVADPQVRQRFAAVARVLAAIDHPHLAHVYDALASDDLCALVLQPLHGGTLRERMPAGGVRPDVACALASAACSALIAGLASNLLHRDVTPENLSFSDTGALSLTDLGLAEVLGGTAPLRAASGRMLCPPAYAAPEQVLGSTPTPATDVYALATVLYETLSGQLPYPGESDEAAMLHRHVHEAPQPLHEVAHDVPAPVAAVVMQGLSFDPLARYADAEAFGCALADAALAAWGPGWVTRTGIEVRAFGRLAERLNATTAAPPVPPPHPSSPRTLRRGPVAAVAGAVAVVAVVLVVVLTHRSGSSPATAGPSVTVTPGVTSGVGGSSSPAATPAPTPATGKLVFSDGMADPKSGWAPDSGQTGNGTAAYQKDGYHVVLLKSLPLLNTFSVASPFTPRLTAMTVSVDTVFVVGSPADGGAVRCDQGNGRNGLRYTFEIHPDGSWLIFKIDGNGGKALAQGTSAAILRGRSTSNTVSGTCAEAAGGVTNLSMAVNGVPVGTVADTHAPGAISWHGALAVYRDAESPGTEVRFTNYRTFDATAT